MNWDAIGASGEVFGAIAVVISIGYLAIQIRESTRTAKLAATRDLFSEFHLAVSANSADDIITEIWLVGVRDRSRLTHADRFRFGQMLYRMLAAFEQQYLHLQENTISSKYFEAQIGAFEATVTYPGVRDFWEANKKIFHDDFQRYVNDLIRSTPETAADEFKPKRIDIDA